MLKQPSMANHGVGKRYRDADLSKLNKEYFGDVLAYAKNFKKYMKAGEGLLLSGSVGSGKTYALVALMKYIKEQRGSLFDYYLVTAPLFFERYATAEANEHDEYRGKPWKILYEETPGFVLNDLGKEDRGRDWQASAANHKLGRILRARNEEQRPIFITTNLPVVPPRDGGVTFEKVYGPSIWSLVQEMTVARSQIYAPDLREKKLQRDDDE